MNQFSINQLRSEVDLTSLVDLNRRHITEWHHYDSTGQKGKRAHWKELSRWERYQHGGPWLDPQLLRLHLEILKETGNIVLVARDADSIIGQLELIFEQESPELKYAHITWMVVDPDWCRKDIGTTLLKEACKTVLNHGCKSLTTTAESDKTKIFYEANGFQVISHKGTFLKQLTKLNQSDHSTDIETIPLDWKLREHLPLGFIHTLGNKHTSSYTWAYLRQMEQLYVLLDSKAPRPHLWLLRQGNAEALTVDYSILHIWLSQISLDDPQFFKGVLNRTERLCLNNGVKTLKAFAFTSHFDTLGSVGYEFQHEEPLLSKPLR